MLTDISLYLTRVITLPDFSARMRDAMEELELADKTALRTLLEHWTTLELISSTHSERASLNEITHAIGGIRETIHNLTHSAHDDTH